jgi:N-acetyl-anhydromuramoyl-L-alanine amidase
MGFAVGCLLPERVAEGWYHSPSAGSRPLDSHKHFSSWIGTTVIIDRVSGWLEGVRRVESPNSDDRPPGIEPELIVVHGISLPPGRFGDGWIDRFFLNQLPGAADPYFATIADLRVSAHVLVARDGALTQYVSFNRRAWHAGRSVHCGRTACNDFSIGIELEGTDDVPYESAQYATLATVIRALRRAYASLRTADVVGHSDIAPGRKTDPGPSFEWQRLRRLLGGRAET